MPGPLITATVKFCVAMLVFGVAAIWMLELFGVTHPLLRVFAVLLATTIASLMFGRSFRLALKLEAQRHARKQ